MKNILLTVIVLAIVAGGAWLGYKYYASSDVERVEVSKGNISDIKAIVQLCSLEIYEDVPIRGTVGKKHIFAKSTFNGSISFDLEKLETVESGDTITVVLPPAVVEISESTEPGSYRVIDTWSDGFFNSSVLTTAEENTVKLQAKKDFENRIRTSGHVDRARKEAAQNLTSMLGSLTGKHVIVIDSI